MGELDVPVLRKAVEWAEGEAARGPVSEWDQGEWYTSDNIRAYRLASKMLMHYEGLHVIYDDYSYSRKVSQIMDALPSECGASYCIAGYIVAQHGTDEEYRSCKDGRTPWSITAAEILGVNAHDTDALFSGGNTIEDVRRFAEDLAGGSL